MYTYLYVKVKSEKWKVKVKSEKWKVKVKVMYTYLWVRVQCIYDNQDINDSDILKSYFEYPL